MRHFAWRFLVSLAVLLMPFGMPVAAAAPVHHKHAGAMAIEHCADTDEAPVGKGAAAQCMMACASALPAADLAPMMAPLALRAFVHPSLIPPLAGIELEIATPPPRRS
jgi:hypothetical protein